MERTFSETEIKDWLATHLPTWRLRNKSLFRVYKTGSWRLTMLLANHIAFIAEAADHHPELMLNYPSVEVHLETHSAGGITQKDFDLALKIEESVTWYPVEESALNGAKLDGWLKQNS